MTVKELIKKEVDNEVYDFITFLESKNNRDNFAKSAQSLSTISFQKIWDNEEDAVYDYKKTF